MSTEAVPPTGSEQPPAATSAPRKRGRVVALAAAFVLSAVAVGGGTGAAILAARSDSSPAHTTADQPPVAPAFGVRPDGSHFGPLDELLLPVPSSDSPGADDATFGNDTVLTADQYGPVFQREYRFLSPGARSSLQSELGLSGLKGYALRSYADQDNGLAIQVTLIQEDGAHAASATKALQTLASATGAFRAGPSVTGFPHAHCYLPSNPYGSSLDLLRCDDAEGDLLITMQVDGVSPLAQSAAADFFREQLSRLATPAAQV